MTDDAKQERDSVAKSVVNLYRFDTEDDRLRALEAIAVYKTRQPQTDATIEAQAAEIERISSQRDAYLDGYKKAFADVVKLHDALERIEVATRNEVRAGDKGYVSRYGINGIARAALEQSK